MELITSFNSDFSIKTGADSVVTLQNLSGGGEASPEVRCKIENASPETARHVALRMYESMKRHGLTGEASEALRRDGGGGGMTEEKMVEGEGEVRKKSEELMGMDYLLKDGFVSYLRDVARITPPIPQQVFPSHPWWCLLSSYYLLSPMEKPVPLGKIRVCFVPVNCFLLLKTKKTKILFWITGVFLFFEFSVFLKTIFFIIIKRCFCCFFIVQKIDCSLCFLLFSFMFS